MPRSGHASARPNLARAGRGDACFARRRLRRAAAPATTAFDGVYKGEAFAENDPGGLCPQTTPAGTMTVSNGHVQLGQYSGYIEPDGSVQMQFRAIFISGSFQPGMFVGQVRNPQPGCLYRLEMHRV